MRRLRSVLLNRDDVVSTRLLVNVLEKADSDGLKHAISVAEVAVRIADHYGFEQTHSQSIWLAGLLHDIGKLGIPNEILRKRSSLTKGERRYAETHVRLGKYMIDRLFGSSALGMTILSHHERFDGKGYPSGLAGEDIPLDARIIAIADFYDAARSAGWLLNRRSHDRVMEEIRAEKGKRFDPACVDAALTAADHIQIAHKSVHSAPARTLRRAL